MSDCACLYGGFDGCEEGREFFSETTRTARKLWVCYECREQIHPKSRYVHTAQSDEGRVLVYRMCLRCAEIKRALYCDGWYWGQLWEDITDQIFSNGGMTIACLEKLTTPEAKRYLQQRWMGYLGVAR